MADLTRLWFIRHGEVQAPYVGRFVGTTDVGLSDLGRHQAQAIASFFQAADIGSVVTSPRRRALDTAAPLVKDLGLRAQIVPDLGEMDFGAWEGKAWPEIEAADPAFAAKWQQDPGEERCPEGESANAFAARVHGALVEVLKEHEGRTVAVFAHAGTNRAILSHVMGRPYMESFTFAQDYGCVNAAAFDLAGRGQVALWNLVPGPRSEAHGDGGRKVDA